MQDSMKLSQRLPRYKQKLSVFMRLAEDLASLSRCGRRRVGAVIVPSDLSGVLSVGYNGPPVGEPNDSCRGGEGVCGCVHAEASAFVKLATERNGLIMLTTLSPCEHCAGLLLNSGRVSAIVYGEEYRDKRGIELLERRGVDVSTAAILT